MKHRLKRMVIPLLFAVACVVGLSIGLRAVAQGHGEAVRIELAPKTETVMLGEAIAYTVTAYDAEENAWDVTAESNYAIEAGAGGSWADNVYTAAKCGTWIVTGTLGALSDTAILMVTHGEAVGVVLTPDPETSPYQQPVAYALTAWDAGGNSWDVTVEAVFSIEAGAGGSWDGNVYTPGIRGTWTVTGTWGGLSDTATLLVQCCAPLSIAITPKIATVQAGESVTYTLTESDAYGNSWDVTAEAAFGIEAGAGGSWEQNIYTAQYIGTWIVTATYQGLTDTTVLTVPTCCPYVVITPDPAMVQAGQPVTYTLTKWDAYGNSWDMTAEATFSIEPAAGGMWKDNVYTAGKPGTWIVTGSRGPSFDTATLMVLPHMLFLPIVHVGP